MEPRRRSRDAVLKESHPSLVKTLTHFGIALATFPSALRCDLHCVFTGNFTLRTRCIDRGLAKLPQPHPNPSCNAVSNEPFLHQQRIAFELCTLTALARTNILSRDARTPLTVAPVKHFRQHSQGRPIATSIAAPRTTGSIRVRVRTDEGPRSARCAVRPAMPRVSSSERIATDPTETESVAAVV